MTEGKAVKLFVLDTNVLMYDPSSLFRFKEHDIYIPMAALEELDANKKGLSEVSRNCRQASRLLDEIVSLGMKEGPIEKGFGLATFNGGHAKGRLFIQTESFDDGSFKTLTQRKNDNEILMAAAGMRKKLPDREVIMVSKDINLRIKAHAMGLPAEDYHNDVVVEDSDLLPSGYRLMPENFWEIVEVPRSWKTGGQAFWEIVGDAVDGLVPNEFLVGKTNEGADFMGQVVAARMGGVVIRQALDYCKASHAVWGLTARNSEQSMALNALMDPNVELVTLLGQAGSGKTILTLAACLEMLFEQKTHQEMIFTRITVPVGEEIGFLPGTEEEKMMPWMGALEDNLEALTRDDKNKSEAGAWGASATKDMIWSKIKVKSMAFMRGRTFCDKLVVVDEAQNLTAKQMKTLITRVGSGSKLICLGNLTQIDAPYLTEGNSGLAHAVQRMRGFEGHAHVTLSKVERSRLADYASKAL